MALLVGVGLAVALAYGLLAALVRWIRLSSAEMRQPTRTREVRLGHECERPPSLTVSGAAWIAGAPATVELVSGSRFYTGATRVTADAGTRIEVPCAEVPRGLYRLRRATVRTTDMLSLFAVDLDHNAPTSQSGGAPLLRVLPVASSVRDTPVFPGFASGMPGDGSSRERSDNLVEARPYHPGDDTRRINWKAYAHSETLFVRIGEEIPPPSFSADIIVDIRGLDRFSDLDRLVSAALGVAEELEARGFLVTLSAQVEEVTPRMLGTISEGRRGLATVDPVFGFLPDNDSPGSHHLHRSPETGGHALVVASDRSPAAPPGSAHAILVWDYRRREGGRHAWTISLLE